MKKIKSLILSKVLFQLNDAKKRVIIFLKRLFIKVFKKNNILTIAIIILFFISAILLLRFQKNIKPIFDNLILMNNEINMHSAMVTIGSSILGALAIIFALSIFSIQQASSSFTSTVLKRLLDDKRGIFYFFTIASISILFLIFSFSITKVNYLFILFFSFWLVFSFFFLLWQYYKFSIKNINPISQIEFYRDRILKTLININYAIEKKIPKNLINKSKEDYLKSKNKFKSKYIYENPKIYTNLIGDFDQIYNIIESHYKIHCDYQLTDFGFKTIDIVVLRYLSFREGALQLTSILNKSDYSHDPFLINIYEKFKKINRLGVERRDIDILCQIIDCYGIIVITSLDLPIPKSILILNSYFTVSLGYLHENIKSCLDNKIYDIGLITIKKYEEIGNEIIIKSKLDLSTIINFILDTSNYGVLDFDKAYFLITKTLKAYFGFVELIILKTNSNYQLKINLIFTNSVLLIKKYLNIINIKKLGMFREHEEINQTVGVVFNNNEELSFLSILKRIETLLDTTEIKEDYKASVTNNINTLINNLYYFYYDILIYAAKLNSKLISFINYNIRDISLFCLDSISSEKIFKKTNDKTTLIKNISLIVINYKRVFDAFKDIENDELLFEVLDSLIQIGYKLHKLSLHNELSEIIDIIISIADNYISKYKGDEVIEASIEIVERAAFLSIHEGSKEIYNKFFDYIKKYQWNVNANNCIKFEEKYPNINYIMGMSGLEYFINCLKSFKDKLYKDINKKEVSWRYRSLSSYEDKLIQEIKTENLEEFLDKLNNL